MAETIGGGGEWTALREALLAKAKEWRRRERHAGSPGEAYVYPFLADELEALAAAAPAPPADEVHPEGTITVNAVTGPNGPLSIPPRGGSSSDLAAPSSPSVAEAGFAYADQMREAFKEWWEAHLRAGGYSPLDSIANHRIKTAFYAGVSAANRPSLPEAVARNASGPPRGGSSSDLADSVSPSVGYSEDSPFSVNHAALALSYQAYCAKDSSHPLEWRSDGSDYLLSYCKICNERAQLRASAPVGEKRQPSGVQRGNSLSLNDLDKPPENMTEAEKANYDFMKHMEKLDDD